jgi:glyoxylase-like metal-dependent hydrolase (beta-lactamase superfamily II)
MCEVSRRRFIAGGTALLAAAARAEASTETKPTASDPFVVKEVAPGVFFAEGDIDGRGFCNNGFVILEDYVLVVDANYPAGARELVTRIRRVTEKPVRFAFDTHHHGDHLYGNQVWVEGGATPVAHVGVLSELRRLETGRYGTVPGRWEGEAKSREDVRDGRFKAPSVLFPKELFFDDGRRRVELLHLGVGHTRGDAFAWLPAERVLFSGDAAVNGPYNFVGDGQVESWIRTLDEARKLGARVVCPGHGAVGDASTLEDQQAFFKALWDRVGTLLAKEPPEVARRKVEAIRADIRADPRIARYASGKAYDPFPDQVAKVYEEITGRKLDLPPAAHLRARDMHARAHGRA